MSECNAKEEFVGHIEDRKVLCAEISKGYYETNAFVKLNVGYSEQQWESFLSMLDFNYDNGYGGQELYGTIWYVDGTWSERGEYDGSEWWDYREVPEVPSYLKGEK
jgi:hypothetical protein